MKILLHVQYCAGLVFVNRLLKEGHDVIVFIKDEIQKHLFDNMVNKVNTIEEGLKFQPDVILFDTISDGKTADRLKKQGYNVVGAGEINDKLEKDRFFGLEIMEKYKIPVPDTYEFKSFDKAIQHIQKKPDRYVIKMDDNQSSFSSYVAKSPDDMINIINHFKNEKTARDTTGFVLQKFVEGFECSIEGWFNGEKFIPELFNHCIEEKKFLTGNLGPTTGSEGSLVYFPDYEGMSKIMIDYLVQMTPFLQEHKYKGPLDLNFIVDKTGQPWALEYCPRLGYVCIENFMDLLDDNFGELIYYIGIGEEPVPDMSKDMCIGVNMTVPPYPMSEFPEYLSVKTTNKVEKLLGARSHNLRIEGWQKNADHFYMTGTYMDEEGNLRIGTYDGDIAAMCGRGETVDEAKKVVYERLDEIQLPEKQYRIDIGERANEWFSVWVNKIPVDKSSKLFYDKITEPIFIVGPDGKNYTVSPGSFYNTEPIITAQEDNEEMIRSLIEAENNYYKVKGIRRNRR